MASRQDTVDFLLDQLGRAGRITFKKMFGEYALYCGGKVVALVCDDQLFVKPTPAGRAFLGAPRDGHPYPGARPHFLIDGDLWEDGDWLSDLIRVTAKDLPAPKPPKAKSKRGKAAAKKKIAPKKTSKKKIKKK